MSLWPSTIKILISNLLRTRKFSKIIQKHRRRRPFVIMDTRWSRSTSNFYALIGQNLTGEFMRQIYAASWNLFIFDSWSWQSFVVNGAFHLVSHMLNPFCNTTIWILCYENGEQENSEREQNLNYTLSLSVTSSHILCFVSIYYFPVPVSRSPSQFPVSRFPFVISRAPISFLVTSIWI